MATIQKGKPPKQKAARLDFTAERDWAARLTTHARRKGISTASLMKLVLTEWMHKEEKTP